MDNIFHKIGSFISRQDYFLKWFILGLINGVVSHIPSPAGEEPNYGWRLFYIQIPSKNKRRLRG